VSPTEAGLRRALLALAAATVLGILVELALMGHTGEPVQLLPFAIGGLGLGALAFFAVQPHPVTGRLLRFAAGLLVLGGAYGTFEHVEHAYAFEAEIQPNADAATHLWAALTGSTPVLAPGAISLAGLLCLTALWQHPALRRSAPR
jgi:hypothetical protein